MPRPITGSLVILIAGLIFSPRSALAQDSQAQLWDAAIAGDTVAIAGARSAGADINALDTRRSRIGRRALNWAALNNHVPALRWLIARGATLNAVNLTGFTPLHHAAEAGAVDAMRALLEAGADFTISNTQGNRPIDTARTLGHAAIVELLEAAERAKPQ